MKYKFKLTVLAVVSLGIVACGGSGSIGSGDVSSDLRDIRGTDTNGNGVRDDVEAKIRAKFSQDPAKMQAWLQYADVLTDVLEAAYLGNKQNLRKADKEFARAISCYNKNYNDIAQGSDDSKYVEALVINTRLRRDADLAYGEAFDGTIIPGWEFKNPCKNNY